jgi:hypothetical protein
MTAIDPFDAVEDFYRAYTAAFAARDLAALEALCEYPMALSDVAGARQIVDGEFYRSLMERFDTSSWAKTEISAARKLRMGADGAIFFLEFVRSDAEGRELPPDELAFPRGCAYFLRYRSGGWKLVGLADRLVG